MQYFPHIPNFDEMVRLSDFWFQLEKYHFLKIHNQRGLNFKLFRYMWE